MTTTFIDFQPSPITPFSFQAVLDGTTYNCTVPYNNFGQRYYVVCQDNAGKLIFSRPMVGSPIGYDISICAGYFTSTLVFRAPNSQFEISDVPNSNANFGVVP